MALLPYQKIKQVYCRLNKERCEPYRPLPTAYPAGMVQKPN
jgi:hypothetical protein